MTETDKLLSRARHILAGMTEEEKEAMYQAQRESYAKSFAEGLEDTQRRNAVYRVPGWKFGLGDLVWKPRGSWWRGHIVGTYCTTQTPRGYAVQLDIPNGPVQIYPEEALIFMPDSIKELRPCP